MATPYYYGPSPTSGSRGGGGGLFGLATHIPGVGWVAHEANQTLTDLENAAINLPGGLWHGTGMLVHHPGQFLTQMAEQTAADLRHPLRHPGFTALDLLGLVPTPISAVSKAVDVGRIVARAGELSPELARATAGLGAEDAYKVAQGMGKAGEYGRTVYTVGEKAGLTKSVGSQVATRIFKGLPQEERLIRIKRTPEDIAATAEANAARKTAEEIGPKQLTLEDAAKPLEEITSEKLLNPAKIPGEKGDELVNPQYLTVKGAKYSRDPTIRAAQKLVDRLYDTFPDETAPMPWRVARTVLGGSQASRASRAERAAQLEIGKSFSREGATLLAKWGGLSNAEHLAARMVLEGTLPHERTILHTRQLEHGGLSKFGVERSNRELATIKEAEPYLTTKEIQLSDGSTHVLPEISDQYPHLQEYVNDLRDLANKRELGAKVAGVLTGESSISRILGPRNLILHGRLPKNITYLKRQIAGYKSRNMMQAAEKAQRSLDEEMGQLSIHSLRPEEEVLKGELGQELINKGQLARVPYDYEKKRLTSFGTTGFRRAYKGTAKRLPGTFTHPFNATVLKWGGGEANVAKLMSESFTEAQRFLGFKAIRDHILSVAQDTPEGIPLAHRRMIRDESRIPGGGLTADQAMAKATRGEVPLSPEERLLDADSASLRAADTIWGGRLYEGIRRRFFPDNESVAADLRARAGGDENAFRRMAESLGLVGEKEHFAPVPGYKWIDDRLLGGLDKSNPLWSAFENKWARRGLQTADAINNVQKAMILYLKPAYILPNLLGNVALSLVHQGFLAPWNLARSFKMFRSMSPATAAGIEQLVGGGFSSGLKATTAGAKLRGLTGRAANLYGKVVDDPLRFSAFLHEASLSGFNTGKELDALLQDPKFSKELQNVSSRANDAMINYERLGPGEQAIMRRLVFFYPWVKGSTRYLNLFLKEHPTEAGLFGNQSQQGTEWMQRTLGEVPSYAQGIFKVGGSDLFPQVINPQSAAIFAEPANMARLVHNVLSGNPIAGDVATQELTPTDKFFLALLTAGKITTLSHPVGEAPIKSAAHELWGGNPVMQLVQSLRGNAASGAPIGTSIYPDTSKWHAGLRFGATGSLTPRELNRLLANLRAYNEAHRTGFVGGNA